MDIQKLLDIVNNPEWAKHPFLEGVECSSLGDVRLNGKILKGHVCSNDSMISYRSVGIGGKVYRVHRLVYEAFYGEIPEGLVIDHINTLSLDNRIENLRACTVSENNRNPITLKKLKERKGTPVVRVDTKTNEVVGYYRSIKEAERKTGSNASTIRKHLSGSDTKRRYRWEKAKYQYSCKWGKWWISGDL